MPFYVYEIVREDGQPGERFEVQQSMSDEPLTECPDCGRPDLRRLIGGGSGIIFKGSGFYVNDSRGSSSSSSGGKKSSSDGKATA